MNERDLIGYGKSPPKVRWPGDARIAISVVVNYEEGSERSLLDGDPHHETNNEVPSPVPPDTRPRRLGRGPGRFSGVRNGSIAG